MQTEARKASPLPALLPGCRAPQFPLSQSHRWVETILAGKEERENMYSFAVTGNTGKQSWSLRQIQLILGLKGGETREQGMAQE